MPKKPDRQCGVPGCPNLIPAGQTLCDEHRRARGAAYERTRDKALKQPYSSKAWRNLRTFKLARQPLCEPCFRDGLVTAAVIVHHKTEVAQGGKFLPAIAELESVCRSCHEKAHKRGAVKDKKA